MNTNDKDKIIQLRPDHAQLTRLKSTTSDGAIVEIAKKYLIIEGQFLTLNM